MIRPDDLNWRVFCRVVEKESGHALSLYEYTLERHYWAECCRCNLSVVAGFHTVDEAMEKWRSYRKDRRTSAATSGWWRCHG